MSEKKLNILRNSFKNEIYENKRLRQEIYSLTRQVSDLNKIKSQLEDTIEGLTSQLLLMQSTTVENKEIVDDHFVKSEESDDIKNVIPSTFEDAKEESDKNESEKRTSENIGAPLAQENYPQPTRSWFSFW